MAQQPPRKRPEQDSVTPLPALTEDSAYQFFRENQQFFLSDTSSFATKQLEFLSQWLTKNETRNFDCMATVISRLAYVSDTDDRKNLLNLFRAAATEMESNGLSGAKRRNRLENLEGLAWRAGRLFDTKVTISDNDELNAAFGICMSLVERYRPKRGRGPNIGPLPRKPRNGS